MEIFNDPYHRSGDVVESNRYTFIQNFFRAGITQPTNSGLVNNKHITVARSQGGVGRPTIFRFMKPPTGFQVELIRIQVVVVYRLDPYTARRRRSFLREIISGANIIVCCRRANGERYVPNVMVPRQSCSKAFQQVLFIFGQGYGQYGVTAKPKWSGVEIIHLVGDDQRAYDHDLRNEKLKDDQQATYKSASPLRRDLIL